jgi:hypothetical protein
MVVVEAMVAWEEATGVVPEAEEVLGAMEEAVVGPVEVEGPEEAAVEASEAHRAMAAEEDVVGAVLSRGWPRGGS